MSFRNQSYLSPEGVGGGWTFFGGNHMVFRRNVGDQSLQQSIKEGEQKKSTANEGKIIIIF